jgi:hypothetical protein
LTWNHGHTGKIEDYAWKKTPLDESQEEAACE